jgi:hypothetical protein
MSSSRKSSRETTKTLRKYDLVDSDDENILEESGSDYEEEVRKEKAKRGIFVVSDSESEDKSKKQNRNPKTSTVSPIPSKSGQEIQFNSKIISTQKIKDKITKVSIIRCKFLM